MGAFGDRLKQERERQGITLDQVATSTKIGTRMLQALEEEHFDQLPGGIFNKGFVRAYARHLGLDEDKAVADYMVAAGNVPVEKEPEVLVASLAAHAVETRGTETAARSHGIAWGKWAVLLLLLAFALALWSAHQRESSKHKTQPQSEASTAPNPAAAVATDPPKASAVPNSAPVSSPTAPTPAAETLATQPPAPAASTQTFSVLVQAREDSWVSITVDGKEVMRDMLASLAKRSLQGQQQIVIRAGNIGGIDLWFNGQKLAAQGNEDEVKTLTFTPTGLQTGKSR